MYDKVNKGASASAAIPPTFASEAVFYSTESSAEQSEKYERNSEDWTHHGMLS